MRPPSSLRPAEAAIVAALAGPGTHSVRSVADAAGLRKMVTYHALRRLRRAGLVTWEPFLSCTIRRTYGVAAHTPTRAPQERRESTLGGADGFDYPGG